MTKHNEIKNIFANPTVKRWVNWRVMMLLFGGTLYCGLGFAADELLGIKDSTKETFGPDSLFVKLIYLFEILVGGYQYVKTKHLAYLVGIVPLLVVTRYAMNSLVFN